MNMAERPGVSPVHNDTIRLAERAILYGKRKVLDVGTGTGYIAIALAKAGADVDATDINEEAISCARDNAEKHNVSIRVFHSNLFENVPDTYELIIFNPPIGGVEPPWQASLKAWIRKSIFKNVISKIISRIAQRKRLPFLRQFIGEAQRHLAPGGIILMHLQSIDIPKLSEYGVKPLEKVFDHTSIVELR